MKNINKTWKMLSSFSRAEKRGLFVLSIILVVLIGYRYSLSIREPLLVDLTESIKEINALDSIFNLVKVETEPFFFNPNTLGKDSLLMLGFSEKAVQNLLKYRSRGGHLYQKTDLKKIYGVTDTVFNRLSEWVLIKEEKRGSTIALNEKRVEKTNQPVKTRISFEGQKPPKDFAKKIDILELNAADSAALVKLPGIGSVFARRIIRYRNLLGGYASPGQLIEVYGMSPGTLSKIEAYLKADITSIRRLNVNVATEYQLRRHPYITPGLAISIIKLRSKNGRIQNISELKQSLANDTIIKKIEPYILF